MESQNSAITFNKDAEMDFKLEIKEDEPWLLKEELPEVKSESKGSPADADLQNRILPFASHFVMETAICSDHPEIVTKAEVKEEPCWTESGSAEPKLELEEAAISVNDFQNDVKDSASWITGMQDDLSQSESHRLRKQTIQRSLRDRSDPFTLPSISFQSLFRLPKAAALEVINELEPYLQHPTRSTGIPIMLKVLSALRFYGQGSYQLSVGQNYSLGLSQSSTSRTITEITNVLNRHLLQRYIKFPVDNDHISSIKQRFSEKFNFPGVIGVIDGTLIAITTPPLHHDIYPAHLFIDRKGRHSLNVQIICDANLQILSINARYPGSVHDAAVWMVSEAKQQLEAMYNRDHCSLWLIGDSGYPNEPWLLTPVLNVVPGSPEDRYNISLRSARNCVERCIGVLKGRFRCLLNDRLLHYSPPAAGRIINACAVLHNFLVARNIPWEEPIQELEDENAAENEQEQGAVLEGRRVRASVIRQYFS